MSSSQGKVLASVSVGRLNLSLKSARKAQCMHAQDKKETINLSKEQLLAFASIGTPAATAILNYISYDKIRAMTPLQIKVFAGLSEEVALALLESPSSASSYQAMIDCENRGGTYIEETGECDCSITGCAE